MTSIFDPSGRQVACTIVEAGPCVVAQVKTVEAERKNGVVFLQSDEGDFFFCYRDSSRTPDRSIEYLQKKAHTYNLLYSGLDFPYGLCTLN